MKKIYLFLLLCMASIAVKAQTAASYTFSRTTGTYTSISGTGSPVSSINSGMYSDDGNSTGIPIGFTFTFCGTNYTTVSACANGVLSLSGAGASWSTSTSNISGTGWLMPLWADLYVGTGAYFQTTGATGSRVFTIEWNGWNGCCIAPYGLNFQVKLYEGSNIVQFCYGSFSSTPTGVVGIANSASDLQTLLNTTSSSCNTSFNITSNQPANGSILQWSYCNPVLVGGTTPFCAGTTTTLSSTVTGGVWSSGTTSIATVGSSSGVVTGVSGGTATISYLAPCGSTVTRVVTVMAAPAAPAGNVPVCVASDITLTDATGSGTWSSGSPLVASVGGSSGVVTGVAAGLANITFTLASTGCQTTAQVTVNALPQPISGSASICPGTTTALADATVGGAWSSGSPGVATIGSTGVATGVTAGIALISYTSPITGCSAVLPLTVNPTPASIGGTLSVCPGLTTTLTDATTGGTWSTSNPAIAGVGAGTGIVTGNTPGVATITYTASTGCTIAAPVTVSPYPPAITGTTNACAGNTSALSDAGGSGSWTSSSPSVATVGIGSGVVTGVVAGITTITFTVASTGCRITTPFLVNSQPAPISGSTSLCVGASSSLSDASPGGSWTSASTAIASIVAGTGFATGVSTGTTNITYTLPTGCYTSALVAVNSLPDAYAVTGGGSFCAGGTGVHVGLAYSISGISYQLYNGPSPVGAPVAGSNSGLDLGLITTPGTYTAVATNPISGCTNTMTGSATVSINPLPLVYNVNGGGAFCAGSAGVSIGLDVSQPGVSYQLYNGVTMVGTAVAGTGAPISFGAFSAAGTYTAVATTVATGCSTPMNGNAIITVNPLPTAYTVTGGGNYCAGGSGVHVGLAGSDAGTTYSLYNGVTVVSTIPSTGGPLDFGLLTGSGTYTVVATDGSGCSANMAGSVNITINPLPVIYTVTGGGGYCTGDPGVHIGLSFSSVGIDYHLWYFGTDILTVHGSGSGLDFGIQSNSGTYTVTAINTTTGCTSTMAGSAVISINPPPVPYNVTGGGNYCLGTSGVHVGTDLSDIGINYQLYRGTTAVGAPQAGTAGPLDFGSFTTPGTYTVIATNALTGCTMTQSGSAVVAANTLPPTHIVGGGGSYCNGGSGVSVTLNGSDVGINYDLMISGYPTGITLSGTGGVLDFGLQITPGVYTVIASNPFTGCTKNMPGSATITINPAPNLFNVTGGGDYCAGGSGVHITLDGSNTGITYQLYFGSSTVGGVISGSGGALDFGARTVAGSYYVEATNPLTGCTSIMNGSGTVVIDPLPNDFAITGGGAYCAGTGGVDISLSGTDYGINYQLYRSGVAIGSSTSGLGLPVDFGFFTTPGVYTVRATDPTFGCVKNMPGSAVVSVISNTVYMVTGGGNYCAGGTGVHIGLSGSASGVTYQLWNSGGPVGTAVSGTGASVDFGLQTSADVYKILATDATYFCTDSMGGSATVVVNALPDVHVVTGGGAYCAGGTGANIGLDLSDAGVNYQLYNGITTAGSPVAGDGSALDFGPHPGGTYTAIATNATTGCSSTMTGSANVTLKPLPNAYRDSVTGENPVYPGYFCATDSGVHVYLKASDTSVQYQLWRGTIMIGGAVTGSGGVLDMGLQNVAGSYTVTGLDTITGCTNNMLGTVDVHIVALPNVHNVTGGGVYCPGGTGVHIGLDGSDPGFTYELFDGPFSAGILFGTGGPLDFGPQIALGNYTILGNNTITTCLNNMFGSATVKYDTMFTPDVTLVAYPGTGVGVWNIDSMRALVTNAGDNPTYQWLINGYVISGATNASFSNHKFFNKDSVTCQVTASGPCGGFTTSKSIVLTLYNVGVNTIGTHAADIKMMPNPNKGVFTVKGNSGTASDEELTLEVTNMLGQVVYNKKITTQNGNINEQVQLSENLANGMYILNVRSGTENTVFHFVIEH